MAGKVGLEGFEQLLIAGGLPELGPGPRANVLPHAALDETLRQLLSHSDLPSVKQELIRALILLWHDRMDAAHAIAQGIEDADGSFLHGIVHRREPDYSNAKYWFRRVGDHACYPEIARRTASLLGVKGARDLESKLVLNGKWDALAFIDLCAGVAGGPTTDPQVSLLREVQGIESEALLEHLVNSN
ncbi:MAG: hypothetical protein JWQ71_3572 [Pedosphaera sp.]|nr:hypothetical protein [Pedosphaera sp.]